VQKAPRPSASTGKVQGAAPAASAAAQIEEVSILDEVEIYLSYGHLEQASTTLRWYVDHHRGDQEQARRLLEIYLALADVDRYAEILERLCEHPAHGGVDCREDIFAGLQMDPQNLQLRVLAEALLGMSVAAIEAELAQRRPQRTDTGPALAHIALAEARQNLEQAIVNPEPFDLGGINLSGFNAPTDRGRGRGREAESPGPTQDNRPLLVGEMSLGVLDEAETTAVAGIISPLTAARQLRAAGQDDVAERLLRRNLILDPRKLALHVELLELLYHRRQAATYAEELLYLYLTLWGAGAALRHRLLHHGQHLGAHPLWSELDNIDGNEHRLAPLAEQYGLYVPITAIPISSPPLILEQIRRDNVIVTADHDDSILHEFNQLLDYGQVEEAVSLLEMATIAQPANGDYYAPLLEMYERMDAQDRFSDFIKSVLAADTQPDEEIMRQMFDLAERLQRRTRHAI
jgi:tetratricopeptide (TPR) repeat protein